MASGCELPRRRSAHARRNVAQNLAWLNRLTLSLLKQHPSKDSTALKHRSGGWNDDFLLEGLTGKARLGSAGPGLATSCSPCLDWLHHPGYFYRDDPENRNGEYLVYTLIFQDRHRVRALLFSVDDAAAAGVLRGLAVDDVSPVQ